MIRVRADALSMPTLRVMQGEQNTRMVQIEVPRYDGVVDLSLCNFVIRVYDADGDQVIVQPYAAPLLTDDYVLVDWMIDAQVSDLQGVCAYCVYASGSTDGNPYTYISAMGALIIQDVPDYVPGSIHVDEFQTYMQQYQHNVEAAAAAAASAAQVIAEARAAADAANSAADRLTNGDPIPGKAATIRIGSVTSGATASVKNSGTESEAVLDFVLKQGEPGTNGATPTFQIGTVSTLAPGDQATVSIQKVRGNLYSLNFSIPRGFQGKQGDPGTDGSDFTTKNIELLESIPMTGMFNGRVLTVGSDNKSLKWVTPWRIPNYFEGDPQGLETLEYANGKIESVNRQVLTGITAGTALKQITLPFSVGRLIDIRGSMVDSTGAMWEVNAAKSGSTGQYCFVRLKDATTMEISAHKSMDNGVLIIDYVPSDSVQDIPQSE